MMFPGGKPPTAPPVEDPLVAKPAATRGDDDDLFKRPRIFDDDLVRPVACQQQRFADNRRESLLMITALKKLTTELREPLPDLPTDKTTRRKSRKSLRYRARLSLPQSPAGAAPISHGVPEVTEPRDSTVTVNVTRTIAKRDSGAVLNSTRTITIEDDRSLIIPIIIEDDDLQNTTFTIGGGSERSNAKEGVDVIQINSALNCTRDIDVGERDRGSLIRPIIVDDDSVDDITSKQREVDVVDHDNRTLAVSHDTDRNVRAEPRSVDIITDTVDTINVTPRPLNADTNHAAVATADTASLVPDSVRVNADPNDRAVTTDNEPDLGAHSIHDNTYPAVDAKLSVEHDLAAINAVDTNAPTPATPTPAAKTPAASTPASPTAADSSGRLGGSPRYKDLPAIPRSSNNGCAASSTPLRSTAAPHRLPSSTPISSVTAAAHHPGIRIRGLSPIAYGGGGESNESSEGSKRHAEPKVVQPVNRRGLMMPPPPPRTMVPPRKLTMSRYSAANNKENVSKMPVPNSRSSSREVSRQYLS